MFIDYFMIIIIIKIIIILKQPIVNIFNVIKLFSDKKNKKKINT